MKPSFDSWKKVHVHRPWSSWGSLTTSVSTIRFLEYIVIISTQMIKKPMRRGTLIDLIFTNKEELVGVVKAGGHCGCSDQVMVEISFLREANKANN